MPAAADAAEREKKGESFIECKKRAVDVDQAGEWLFWSRLFS